LKGTVLACGRYGCAVRLEDGRVASLPASDPNHKEVRRALAQRRRPQFSFAVTEQDGWLIVRLEQDDASPPGVEPASAAPERSLIQTRDLDDKIIEYLRQTEDWDPNGAIASRAHEAKQARADRLLPFEVRARRQYRESPKKPPRPKKKR
jgi:hypothetical protein